MTNIIWENKPPSQDELDAIEAQRLVAEKIKADTERKLTGIEFEGVMCSATSADQSGLMAVLMAIQMQGASFPNTRFEFENGSVLVIGLHNYEDFTAVWLPFRQGFFAVGGV